MSRGSFPSWFKDKMPLGVKNEEGKKEKEKKKSNTKYRAKGHDKN